MPPSRPRAANERPSWMNVATASVSALAPGSIPASASACSAWAGDTPSADDSELRRVLRRCANAGVRGRGRVAEDPVVGIGPGAPDQADDRGIDARRRQEAGARHPEAPGRLGEQTELHGVSTVRFRARRRPSSCRRPRPAPSPWRSGSTAAPRRSGARRSRPRSREGWRRATSGGLPSLVTRSAMGTRVASARIDVTGAGPAAVVSASTGSSAGSASTATIAAASRASATVSVPMPGADLEHDVVRPRPRPGPGCGRSRCRRPGSAGRATSGCRDRGAAAPRGSRRASPARNRFKDSPRAAGSR